MSVLGRSLALYSCLFSTLCETYDVYYVVQCVVVVYQQFTGNILYTVTVMNVSKRLFQNQIQADFMNELQMAPH